MGLVIIEGYDAVGQDFHHHEYRTRACVHCRAVIMVWQKTGPGADPPVQHRCNRCDGPLCKHCAKQFAERGCIPFLAKVDHAVKAGRWDEEIDFTYRSCTRM